ncbi:MAG: hypothetical protein JO093_05995 [Acidobacteria bacterium]|nr:hypothetical protein [Acidobacteriota bacterium]MBV9067277.1 hypothetical protein [Acidobacteriota bacterium]MBV9185150.1 hypothetical protein [Acidobacteriota bacterium]
MTCKRALAILCFVSATATARADDVRVLTGAVLYESGLAAPSIELRSVAQDGSLWRGGINGWSFSLGRERLLDHNRRLIFEVTATPYDAHSSKRIYRDGVRRRDLEFDDAAFTARAALRFRESEHASIEPGVVVGKEIIGNDAPAALRDAWRSPYAGVTVTQRIRFITAEDPFTNRIDGINVTATGEAYHGNRTWTRAMVTENGGASFGRIHFRQSLAAYRGSSLDTVSAFLIGGSWDLLGSTAVYGRRYAEFRVNRGINGNAGADFAITRSFDLGLRVSAFRSGSLHTTGTLLQATQRLGGYRLTAGAGRSNHRTTVVATVGGAIFLR